VEEEELMGVSKYLSIVVPVFNEEKNIPHLHASLSIHPPWEIQRRHRREVLDWFHEQFQSGVQPDSLYELFAT